jgi:hypothetical protein
MKKIIIITSMLILVASSSFAAISSGNTGDMSMDSVGLTLYGASTGVTASSSTAQIGKTSTGVSVGWATNVNGYALVTQHKSGTKAYGSSYDSTALFQTIADGTPGTVILAKPAGTDTVSFTSANGWKSM